jgi:hypothetical protein
MCGSHQVSGAGKLAKIFAAKSWQLPERITNFK